MKGNHKEKALKLLFNPFVIAIPFALITILLFPIRSHKNSLETYTFEPADKMGRNTTQYYYDLDNDGIHEMISHFENGIEQSAIKIIRNQEYEFGQWNFDGVLPPNQGAPAYLDFNQDGILDVFTFYQRKDSLFIGAVDMLVDSAKLVNNVFLDRIKVVNNTTDYGAIFNTVDLNMDGRKELLMFVNAGYSEQPRRIYAWDFNAGKIYKSPIVGFRNDFPMFKDIDGDNLLEIIPSTTSYENIEKGLGIPFNDYERWFVIYDHKLRFRYGPVRIGRGGGSVIPYILHENNRSDIYLLDDNREKAGEFQYYKFNIGLAKPVAVENFFNQGNLSFNKVNSGDDAYYFSYGSDSGRMVVLDAQNSSEPLFDGHITPGMSYVQLINLPGYESPVLFFIDSQGEKNMLRFFDISSLREVVHYAVPAEREYQHISVYKNVNGKELVAVQIDENIASLEFKTDPYYLVKFIAIHVFIYLFYIALIWLILRWQNKILKKHYQREQLIAELKLKSIRNQLDPHFTFNAVNAIASAIYREEKEKAYNYFSLFSKLLRSTTLYSDRMTRKLSDEIEITMQYLDIELFRYSNKFEYTIDVADDVNVNQQVPRMIVQTFAESAVTNGLMHRRLEGKLKINIRKKGKNLELIFEDNGVGIEESKRLNKLKAFRSILIMDEFIRIFNDLNNTNVNYQMKDIEPEGPFPGTRIIVTLPADHFYKAVSEKLS